MSDFRKGVCLDCDAQFKIPTSFTHDRAKCNQCGGTVEIATTEVKDATPPPVPVAPKVKPMPAKPAPPKAAPPAAEPEEKPMTMKEKILARKKADAAAAQATPPTSPTGKAKATAPKASATSAKAAAPSAGAPRAKAAGAEAKGTRAGGRKAAGAKGGSSKRGASKRGAEEAEESGRRGRAQKEKKSPVAGLIGVAVLVIGGGAGWYFTMGPGAAEEPVKKTEIAESGPTPEELAIEAAATEQREADKAAAQALKAEEDAAAKVDPAEAAPAAPNVEKVYEPLEIKYDEFPIFGKAIDTSDEEWAKIEALAAQLVDMDYPRDQGRAAKELTSIGYKSLPAVFNRLREIDLGTSDGYIAGDLVQRTVTDLLHGKNMTWDSERDGSQVPTPRAHMVNRKSVRAYLMTWNTVVADPTVWIGLGKLENEKYSDELPAYAAALEAAGITEGQYIDAAIAALSGASDDDEEEDLGDF